MHARFVENSNKLADVFNVSCSHCSAIIITILTGLLQNQIGVQS